MSATVSKEQLTNDLKSNVGLREALAKAVKKGKTREERIQIFVKEAHRLNYPVTEGDLLPEEMDMFK